MTSRTIKPIRYEIDHMTREAGPRKKKLKFKSVPSWISSVLDVLITISIFLKNITEITMPVYYTCKITVYCLLNYCAQTARHRANTKKTGTIGFVVLEKES